MGRPVIDLVGQVFGKLTVVELDETRGSNAGARWLCRCECGGSAVVPAQCLKAGDTRSCGCLLVEVTVERCRKAKGMSACGVLYREYLRNAARRDLEFALTRERFEQLTSQPCHYCGIEPEQILSQERYYGDYVYNGIDRVDNDEGYIIGNCVPCCKQCNWAKGQLAIDDFLSWVNRVYEYSGGQMPTGGLRDGIE